MELHQLRAFLAVAEEGSFRGAATRLRIGQPAVSRSIKQLESELAAMLFERTTRSVRLTPAGHALVDPARTAVDAVEEAGRAVAGAATGETGVVRVGFAGPSSHNLISALTRHVRAELPATTLVFTSTTFGTEALDQLREGRLDVAIVSSESMLAGLASRVVRIDRYVIVLPEDHPLAQRPELSMAELVDEPWVVLEEASGTTLTGATIRKAQESGFTPRVAQTAPDTWTVLALVAAGVGITMTVDTAFHQVLTTGIAVVPLTPASEAAYARLVWRAESPNPALHRVLELSQASLPTPPGL